MLKKFLIDILEYEKEILKAGKINIVNFKET